MRPVPSDTPFPLSALLQEIRGELIALRNPAQPVTLASVNFADLPPAADWPNGAIIVADRNSIATSSLVAGVWTWRRADGTAL